MKKYIIGIIALLFGVAGVAAFTTLDEKDNINLETKTEPVSGPWFYLFDSDDPDDRFDETKYIYINPQPLSEEDVLGCDGVQLPCVIRANGTQNGHPDASEVENDGKLSEVIKSMKNIE